ncbi:MAG: nitroreductase family deazaflavin-dependent oxidoreductase [Caldilineaceae bacterium]|nr:nitroreductase family deazaflavin-dependent oxidoreductase [Caldilineaceae bacterium]MCB0121837.1 nitroreductase family deazaflavin-dependent oxidoreductase [Caldilineaceae bacterium]
MASVSKPMKQAMKVANGLHVALYRISGGKLASEIANLPILLITTTGRKSGKPHTNPVVYLKEGQDFLVAASVGGMDWHPSWYFNLKELPQAKIKVGNQTFAVQATITSGDERDRLYEKFKAASNNFAKYEKNTSRVIPVIRLTPTQR